MVRTYSCDSRACNASPVRLRELQLPPDRGVTLLLTACLSVHPSLCTSAPLRVGHFFHEHNTPATFIYPTYSLMGDFNMWMRIIIGNESF